MDITPLTIVLNMQTQQQDTCLGRTCMKWCADGELTELDFKLIMERLVSSDHHLRAAIEAGERPLRRLSDAFGPGQRPVNAPCRTLG